MSGSGGSVVATVPPGATAATVQSAFVERFPGVRAECVRIRHPDPI
jgi:hypothetical protein